LLEFAVAAVALVGVFVIGLGLAQQREVLIALALSLLGALLQRPDLVRRRRRLAIAPSVFGGRSGMRYPFFSSPRK